MQRGAALASYDRAAWVSTDDLLARLPAARRGEVGGWIVTPDKDGLHVDYYGQGVMADRVIYAAGFDGTSVVRPALFEQAQAPLLSALATRMIRALDVARAELPRHDGWRPCAAAPFNTVVLPPGPDGIIPVYFLTPQPGKGAIPFGGHYEVDVAADGHIASARAFAKSCLTMAPPQAPPGVSPAGLMVTHLLDPQPTEIHVFEQLQAGLPVYVSTGTNVVWKVESGRIERVRG